MDAAGLKTKTEFHLTSLDYKSAGASSSEKARWGRVPFAAVNACPGLSGSAVKCLLVICGHAGADFRAWPSRATIAQFAGLHLRTVAKAIRELESAGILQVTPGGGRGRSNVYQLQWTPVETPVQQPPFKDETPVQRPPFEDETPPERPPFEDETPAERPLFEGETGASAFLNGGLCVPKQGPVGHPNIRGKVHGKKRAAAPPAVEGAEGFELTPEETRPECDGLNVGELVAMWAKGHKARTGSPLAKSARGRVAGTLKRLAAEVDFEQLRAAIGRWFGADRESFSAGLFERKLQDGDADLTGRRVAPIGPQRQATRPANFAAAAPGVSYDAIAHHF